MALAGISAAVALLLVWLSVLVRFSTIAFYVAAGCALMVPLSKKYYASSVFAYVASAALAFVIAGDIVTVAGYVIYFGPMSIALAIMYDKRVKWYVAYPIKILYMNGALALMYFVLGTIMIDSSLMGEIPYWAVAVVGTAGLLLIDLIMQMVYKFIMPKVSRVIRLRDGEDKAPIANEKTEDDDEPSDHPFFDEEEKLDGVRFDRTEGKKKEKNAEKEKEPSAKERDDDNTD